MCPFIHNDKCNRGCKGFQCQHRDDNDEYRIVTDEELQNAANRSIALLDSAIAIGEYPFVKPNFTQITKTA